MTDARVGGPLSEEPAPPESDEALAEERRGELPEERARGVALGRLALGALLLVLGIGWLLEILDVADVAWGAILPAALIVIALALLFGAGGRHSGLITLGVGDLDRARRFYAALGWTPHPSSPADVAFYQAGGMVLALWDRARLAEDSAVTDTGGWGGATLAYNTRSRAEVDAVIDEARAAGATIGREPAEAWQNVNLDELWAGDAAPRKR